MCSWELDSKTPIGRIGSIIYWGGAPVHIEVPPTAGSGMVLKVEPPPRPAAPRAPVPGGPAAPPRRAGVSWPAAWGPLAFSGIQRGRCGTRTHDLSRVKAIRTTALPPKSGPALGGRFGSYLPSREGAGTRFPSFVLYTRRCGCPRG
jgi:hypothetical protein